jgi:hypothetical protein
MRATLIAGAGVLMLTLVAGCGQAAESVAESAVENATGADIDISEGGESITVTDEEGTDYSVTTGESAQFPDGLPAEFPQPDGATLGSVVEVGDGGYGLSWEWPGATKGQFEDYLASIEAAGFTREGDVISTDMGPDAFQVAGQYSGYGYSMTVVGFGDASLTQVSLTATPEQ